jgi:importin subunit beta-1
MPENSCPVAAGYTLENIAKAIGDDCLEYILTFIQPKIGSQRWGERYIGMIAFGSIIDGPGPEKIYNSVSSSFEFVINMLNDPIPKVRQTVAFVLYKISEFVPQLIWSDP